MSGLTAEPEFSLSSTSVRCGCQHFHTKPPTELRNPYRTQASVAVTYCSTPHPSFSAGISQLPRYSKAQSGQKLKDAEEMPGIPAAFPNKRLFVVKLFPAVFFFFTFITGTRFNNKSGGKKSLTITRRKRIDEVFQNKRQH